MKPPFYEKDLIQWLQLSGEYIGRMNLVEKRAEWILFLVDEVKGFLSPAEYTDMMTQLSDAIAELRGGS